MKQRNKVDARSIGGSASQHAVILTVCLLWMLCGGCSRELPGATTRKWVRDAGFALEDIRRATRCFNDRQGRRPLSVEELYDAGCLQRTTGYVLSEEDIVNLPIRSNPNWCSIDDVFVNAALLAVESGSDDLVVAVVVPREGIEQRVAVLTSGGDIYFITQAEWFADRERFVRALQGDVLWQD